VPAYLRTTVDRGPETWRNRTILELEQAKIASYTTRNARETVTVERGKDGEWSITSPTQDKARPDIVGMVLRSLAALRASGFADSTVTGVSSGLDADTAAVVVKTDDGTSYTIHVGAMTPANQSYTRKDGDPVIYLVPRGRWNTIFRPASALSVSSDAGVMPSFKLPGAK
jgi:cytoskeletal protein RodZ